jgi:starvation-inducible outer membrane lipoprotein
MKVRNKMKTATTIFLLVLAVGLIITGCSKAPAQVNTNLPTSADANAVADITVDTTTANPDIGALDDTAVSEDLPQ